MPAENLNHFTEEYKLIIQRGVNMNTNFFINCRWYKTPCKTVLNADEFVVEFLTDEYSIVAKVSDKCYFLSIDNIRLFDIKCDFHFSRNYTTPKEFLSNLYDTFECFLNTSIPFTARHFPHSSDEIIRRILELQEMKKESSETEDTTEKEPEKVEKELIEPVDTHKEDIKKFKEKSSLNSLYGISEEDSEVNQFERLTRTLYKSLFKAIGLEETRKIPFIISNNMVFFNYNGIQYKYYPSQCKIFRKCERKYKRINWKNFAEENNPDGQKQSSGRSPPFYSWYKKYKKMIND